MLGSVNKTAIWLKQGSWFVHTHAKFDVSEHKHTQEKVLNIQGRA